MASMNLFFVIASLVVTVLTAIPVLLQLRGHPKGLFILFFAEMWERFSYYGMRGLFVFYLTQQFLFKDTFAQGQYGAYTALVYLLPLLGGFLADKYLGTRKAIAFGALLLVAGHFSMAVEGRPAVQTLTYQGHSYVFQVDGRGDNRIARLKVGDGLYEYGPNADGGLQIKGLPATAPLPSVLSKGSYDLPEPKRNPLFVGILYLALSLIIMGVGYLKANISTIVGQLYPEKDPRRDPGFTLYYYGINLGATWASVLCGGLGQTVGWWLGFGLAGVGMLAGFVVFVWGKPLLQGKGEPPNPVALKKKVIGPVNFEWSLYLLGIVGVGVVWVVLVLDGKLRAALDASVAQVTVGGGHASLFLSLGSFFALVGTLLLISSIGVLVYLFRFMAAKCSKIEAERLGLALILIAASVVFWALFEQAGSTMNQFAERNTQLDWGPIHITASQAQAFNGEMILIGAPIFAWIWAVLGRRGRDLNPVVKFSLGLLQAGASFLLLAWGGSFHDAAFRVPLAFLFFAYALQTTGELCLSPVGLSQMTKLAVTEVLSTMMAVWFLASAWAQWIAAAIGKLTATETIAGIVVDPAKALDGYVHTFFWIGVVGVGVGLGLWALSPWLKHWAHGASDVEPRPEVDGDRQTVDPAAV
jgi:POT family proton-dependent oligopeptide transporter